MKIDQILNEGFLDNVKASFKKGQKDYIAKRAGELGITGSPVPAPPTPAPSTPSTSVPVSTPTSSAPAPKAPAKKTLNAFIKEIDGLSKQQQIKIYNYLQDKLF